MGSPLRGRLSSLPCAVAARIRRHGPSVSGRGRPARPPTCAESALAARALRDEERLLRFEREARTISALNHPNILTVYDVGHAAGMQFLATEYIDGVTLRTVLERGRVEVREAVTIGIQIAQAVSAAHDAGIVHRDLKPENVMIRGDGYVKVLDFGLTNLTGRESFADAEAATRLVDTKDGVVVGTFTYMAPEQARGTDIDFAPICLRWAFFCTRWSRVGLRSQVQPPPTSSARSSILTLNRWRGPPPCQLSSTGS